MRKLVFSLLILLTCGRIYAQVLCPPNIDFELGNFNNWTCKAGNVSMVSDKNIISLYSTGPVSGRHTTIPSTNMGKDFYGDFPVVCPNGSGFSVKLGNNNSGQEAEGIFYTYTIPANVNNFSVLYQYAVVFEEPTDHLSAEQPRFQARIVNVTDNTIIDCVSFDFTASSSLPGFKVSPKNSSNGTKVLYKDWTPVTINLSKYAGKTIQIEFITSDCTKGGHFGYAYVDVNSSCRGVVAGSTICTGDTAVNLTAPYGFQSYSWYSDNTFSQVIGDSQVLTVNPAPTVGTAYPVIVTPYPGFGCIDTVFATITTAARPVSDAGANALACKNQQVQLGTTPNPFYSYIWSPANLVSNPSIANPSGFATSFTPVDFIVKTIDKNTGCFSYDTVKISPKIVDTTINITGPLSICASQNINTSFQINPSATAVQWFNDSLSINRPNNNTYYPATAGVYWAQVQQNGCTDTSRKIQFIINPLPQPYFTVNKDTQCVTNNSFLFNNTSSIINNTSLSYTWQFNNGSTSLLKNPTLNFTRAGIYNVTLIATSINGCSDSISNTVNIMPNVTPDFKWDSICTNRDAHFINLSNENGSVSVKYVWDFGNGISSVLKHPLPFIYSIPGVSAVTLSATSLGCESDVKTVQHNINANKPVAAIRFPDRTIGYGYTSVFSARESKGSFYKWSPGIQLNNSHIRNPVFSAVNDVKYEITIVDKNGCLVTDTLQAYVLKTKGSYLPNAFTPNGDGINDVIHPYVIGMKNFGKFSVYNRWGSLVFTTTVDGKGWDGTFNGSKLDSAVFVWILEYRDMSDKPIVQKGSIMLIR